MSISCADLEATFGEKCVARAHVEIEDATGYAAYLKQHAQQYPQELMGKEDKKFWSTQDFSVLSDWFEQKEPNPKLGIIHEDDYRIRERSTGKLVATIYNVALRTAGIDSDRSRTCMYDFPELYAPYWR